MSSISSEQPSRSELSPRAEETAGPRRALERKEAVADTSSSPWSQYRVKADDLEPPVAWRWREIGSGIITTAVADLATAWPVARSER